MVADCLLNNNRHPTISGLREVTEAAMVTQHRSHYSRPVLLLATLALKNAFNSLKWSDVLHLDYNFSVPHYILAMITSYLTNKQLAYNTSSGLRVQHITLVAAQGSILGSYLWNVN